MEDNLKKQVDELTKKVVYLEGLIKKDVYSDLDLFRKEVVFKNKITVNNLQTTTTVSGELYNSGGFIKII